MRPSPWLLLSALATALLLVALPAQALRVGAGSCEVHVAEYGPYLAGGGCSPAGFAVTYGGNCFGAIVGGAVNLGGNLACNGPGPGAAGCQVHALHYATYIVGGGCSSLEGFALSYDGNCIRFILGGLVNHSANVVC